MLGHRWLEGEGLPGLRLYGHERWDLENVHLQLVSKIADTGLSIKPYLSIARLWDWLSRDLHVHTEHFLLLELYCLVLSNAVCSAVVVA